MNRDFLTLFLVILSLLLSAMTMGMFIWAVKRVKAAMVSMVSEILELKENVQMVALHVMESPSDEEH